MKTSPKQRVAIAGLIGLGAVVVAGRYLPSVNLPVLFPEGWVGREERNLILFALALSLIVILPVFTMLFWFAWRYRESNHKGHKKYSPDWDGSRLYETIWWLIPAALILILSVVTWTSSHRLDPYKPLASDKKTLNVQVVALRWKWLFIYPDQQIATVNYLQIPQRTPVKFTITSDGPMNSFWVPQLGGQVYAMSGMSSNLYLEADKVGQYFGTSANISGPGFADMRFKVASSSEADFKKWAASVGRTGQPLTVDGFEKLALPSYGYPATYFKLPGSNLYDSIVQMKTPGMTSAGMEDMH